MLQFPTAQLRAILTCASTNISPHITFCEEAAFDEITTPPPHALCRVSRDSSRPILESHQVDSFNLIDGITMSYPTRSLSTRLPGTGSQNASSAGPSPMLVARITEKKAELEHLRELRDLSAAVAGQMEALEQKLSTLSDGTEGGH